MVTYFTLIKYIGRDFFNIDGKLTEDQLRGILLRSDDESLFQVSEWDEDLSESGGTPKLLNHVNGEEWLNNHLLKDRRIPLKPVSHF